MITAVEKMQAMIDSFKENTTHTVKDGRHTIKCDKGLWSITAPLEEQAMREAFHYFRQYYRDGEYEGC